MGGGSDILPRFLDRLQGLTERAFHSTTEFHQLYALALKKRAVGSHQMNSESSRSHLCCILNLQIQSLTNGEKINSKLHLIDLAGSEMVRKTSAQGTRLNEAKFINKSLSALGNVINALTSTQSGSSTGEKLSEATLKHIPYRDSKLTRLLQDSLSGNSKTILLLTISLSTEHFPETLSTLRFGERARKLKTKPRINVEQNDLNAYKQNYLILEKQFLSLKGTLDEMKREIEHKDCIIAELKNRISATNDNIPCVNCEKLEEIIRNLRSSTNLTCASPLTNRYLEIEKVPVYEDNRPSLPLSPSPIQGNVSSGDETRCAVCGLNEIETEQLHEDTGESLGGFFTCDGNCGNIFHVRCAGEIGEGGQYTVPSGEWYCTTCSVLDDDQDRQIIPPTSMDTISEEVPTSTTEEHSNSQQYLRVLSEYHKIRRERNRILNQWQHEQRLLKQRNDWRDQKEFELNQELISAKEIINKLQDDMCGHIREQKSLEKRLSDAVTELLLLKTEKLKAETTARSSLEEVVNAKPITEEIDSQKSTLPKNANHQPVPQNPYAALTVPVVEIPKPWTKKKSSIKKSQTLSTQEDLPRSQSSAPPVDCLDEPNTSPPKKGRNCLPTSPIRQHSATSSLHESLDLPSLLLPDNSDISLLSSSVSLSSSSKSPFNKRLINLIQIVKEETGAYAEIRKKYRERESERSMLKSRHQGSNSTTGTPSAGASLDRISSDKQKRENIKELDRKFGTHDYPSSSAGDRWGILPSL